MKKLIVLLAMLAIGTTAWSDEYIVIGEEQYRECPFGDCDRMPIGGSTSTYPYSLRTTTIVRHFDTIKEVLAYLQATYNNADNKPKVYRVMPINIECEVTESKRKVVQEVIDRDYRWKVKP